MNLVDRLRKESSSEHVAFTEFILKLKRNSDKLFCFFEGKDDNKYYGIRIKNITQQDYEHFKCGGKENVIKVCNLISNRPEYDKVKAAYFVDSDYQERIEINNIYCLPSYSIENQYINRLVLERILRNEFSLNDESEDFNIAVNLYEALLSKFHEDTTLINAWLACQSDKRFESGLQPHINIDSTIGLYFRTLVKSKMNDISDLSDLNDIAKINSLFPDAHNIKQDELDDKIIILKNKDQISTFRGKFELAFFIDFLSKLQSEICSKSSSIFNNRHKCSLRFEYSTALTNLSIYAETPESLIKYLEIYKRAA